MLSVRDHVSIWTMAEGFPEFLTVIVSTEESSWLSLCPLSRVPDCHCVHWGEFLTVIVSTEESSWLFFHCVHWGEFMTVIVFFPRRVPDSHCVHKHIYYITSCFFHMPKSNYTTQLNEKQFPLVFQLAQGLAGNYSSVVTCSFFLWQVITHQVLHVASFCGR